VLPPPVPEGAAAEVVDSMRRPLGGGLAEGWSNLGSPPVMVLAAFVMVSSTMGGADPWIWTGVHLAVAVLFPLVMLVALHRLGEVSDFEVSDRRQRLVPLLMTLVCTVGSLVFMEAGSAPGPHVRLALAYAAAVAVLVPVSPFWKISVHTAAAAVAGTVSWQLTGSPLWLLLLVSTMAASRVVLGRHTPAQVAAGALLGVAVTRLFVS